MQDTIHGVHHIRLVYGIHPLLPDIQWNPDGSALLLNPFGVFDMIGERSHGNGETRHNPTVSAMTLRAQDHVGLYGKALAHP